MNMYPNGTAGVYVIRHKPTGKSYIGSTSRCLNKRKQEHWRDLNKGVHFNPRLQNAWSKYGEDAFEFVVLFECDAQCATSEEQKAIDTAKPYYNICPVSKSRLGVKVSPESRERIQQAAKKRGGPNAETCRKIALAVSASCAKGERHNKAKLKASDVAQIKARLIKGEMPRALAEEYGVHTSTIRYIRSGKIWQDVEPANDQIN